MITPIQLFQYVLVTRTLTQPRLPFPTWTRRSLYLRLYSCPPFPSHSAPSSLPHFPRELVPSHISRLKLLRTSKTLPEKSGLRFQTSGRDRGTGVEEVRGGGARVVRSGHGEAVRVGKDGAPETCVTLVLQ